jgi:hypothetical protein
MILPFHRRAELRVNLCINSGPNGLPTSPD